VPQVTELGLDPRLAHAAAAQGWSEATPLQAAAVPVLRRGGTAVLHASSGSGITGAYALPLLDRLADESADEGPRALVLAPSPDGAARIASTLAVLGASVGVRVRALLEGWRQDGSADVVVATPVAALGALEVSALKLEAVQVLVLVDLDLTQRLGGGAAVDTLTLGLVVQRVLLRPMYVGGIERRDEYATIVTIAMMVFFRNLAIVLGGPNQFAPKDYARPIMLLTLPISGNRFVALIGTLVLLSLFYLVIKKTWIGRALRGASQNRVGIQTAGIDVLRLDMLAFGVGVALAAAAGALLAPDFLVYPENGSISTFKGFEIIVIGGLGSILGSIAGGVLLGVIEALGSVFLSASYKDLYGFLLLIVLLVFRPTGLFGERERTA